MSDFTLPNTAFPTGTSVSAYDATGYQTFPGKPPGSAVATAEVVDGSVTFEGLLEKTPYFAAALVAGEWRAVHFVVGLDSITYPVETASLASGVFGVRERDEQVDFATQAELDAVKAVAESGGAVATNGMGFVNHGSDPNVARPAYACVTWRGSVEPVNMAAVDFWAEVP